MPCGWEGNRRSGVALAMSHKLQLFINPPAGSRPRKGRRIWHSFTFLLLIRPVAKLVAFTVAVSGTVYVRYVTHPNRADTPSTVHIATTEVPFTRTCVSDVIELVDVYTTQYRSVCIWRERIER